MKQFNLSEWLQNKSRKIVTRDGRPVRIVCWDVKGFFPILALIEGNGEMDTKVGEEYPCSYKIDGTCPATESYDLFFADDEELTEFEKDLQTIISEASHWTSEDGSISTYCQFGDKEIKKISVQILDIARKGLQPEFDKEMDKMLAETDKVVYQKGKQDALKDLPKWRKTDTLEHKGLIYGQLIDGDYYLYIKELKDKLPKEE